MTQTPRAELLNEGSSKLLHIRDSDSEVVTGHPHAPRRATPIRRPKP